MTAVDVNYIIEATKRTPSVKFDKNLGELSISGKSMPEYSHGFYGKILDEVDDYISNARQLTILNFNVEYLNSISSKMIMQLILKLEILINLGKKVKVFWHYHVEDDMMFELGNVYKSSTKIPVSLIAIND